MVHIAGVRVYQKRGHLNSLPERAEINHPSQGVRFPKFVYLSATISDNRSLAKWIEESFLHEPLYPFVFCKRKLGSSSAAKLMLNLQCVLREKKRPVAVLGETRPVYPD
jgi:hypothetical protein